MISPEDVTACLVTRGDQPDMMRRIHDALVFEKVVVWDNSQREDWKCAGRYKAAELAETELVYFQDDDVIVPSHTQRALLAAYEAPVVANWAHGENPDGLDDLPLVGAGAIADRRYIARAIERYAEHHPLDDAFGYEADCVVGVLYPAFKHVRLPFHIEMPVAQHPSRLCNQPWQRELRFEITDRARWVRDNT